MPLSTTEDFSSNCQHIVTDIVIVCFDDLHPNAERLVDIFLT